MAISAENYATHDFDGWLRASEGGNGDGSYVQGVGYRLRVPEAVVLTKYDGYFRKQIRFSRRSIFERDASICQYCGRRLERSKLTLDHIVPRSRGGKSVWENMVVACNACNDRKRDLLPEEAGMRLLKRPEPPGWPYDVDVQLGLIRKPFWRRFVAVKPDA